MESHLFIKLYCLFTIQFLKLLVTICCCGFAACKSYERPGRQIGKYWNSLRFSEWNHWRKCRVLWKEKFQWFKLYARPEAKISPQVMISVVSQHVIGFTCHNESMLIGLFRQRQFAEERKWLFVSADVLGAGTYDEPLRTSAWEAIFTLVTEIFSR